MAQERGGQSGASSQQAQGSKAPAFRYTAALADRIETKWQRYWDEHDTFVQPNPGQPGFEAGKPKFYCLDMFPYPSGAGLHVGHPEGYTATDIICRFMRMTGHNVLHPMGWDAFGLPAEQYAIQTGVHPAQTTKSAIDNFRRQLKRFGFSYDWTREVATIDEDYYGWTQWIWLKAYNAWFDAEQNKARPIDALIDGLERGDLRVGPEFEPVHVGGGARALEGLSPDPVGFTQWHELDAADQRRFIDEQRLAYIGEVTVNWCPKLGTVLANEEVIDGRSERGGFPVLRRPLRQWMFRITAYAERLLDGLAGVDWPESTKTMQAEWIGRSEGAHVDFELDVPDEEPIAEQLREAVGGRLRVYTTRPDTLFGATYMVVAPEHPLVDAAIEQPQDGADVGALKAYVDAARNKADVDRMADSKEKTGVFTGVHAINPTTGQRIPVWTADYVLMGYGTGAIMAVPAHDQRDFDFAQAFGLPIRDVVYPRFVAAMAYFTEHTLEEEQTQGRFINVLADFVGYVISNDVDPELFASALKMIRTRRGDRDDYLASCEMTPDVCVIDRVGAVGLQRGAVKTQWFETIESVGLGSYEKASRIFVQAIYQREIAGEAYAGQGFAANSAGDGVSLNGLATAEAKARIVEWLTQQGVGRSKTNYRLRDWLFSRQRYWGEPFPVVFTQDGRHYPVSEANLPVTLPELADYTPPESDDPLPLLGKVTDWVKTTAGDAGVDPDVLDPDTPVVRETNTMPGWAGSCWYYLRYCDPKNGERFIGQDAERYWMDGEDQSAGMGGAGGVDLYVGGAEHAVLHLLYARFWHKLLFDLGYVSTDEPFAKLFHQGLVTSHAFMRADKSLVPVDEVDQRDDGAFVERATGEAVTQTVAKMSKSLKNVVNPDDVIAEYGADTFRLYEMYMGPLEASKPWNTRDIVGLSRFLQRAWRLVIDEETGQAKLRDQRDDEVERQLHKTIQKVREDIPKLSFNTAIAAMIEFVNAATSASGLTKDQAERFALVLAPFAPHMGEELWATLGHEGTVAYEPFPEADPTMLVAQQVELPVQVMGKTRSKISVAPDASEDAIKQAVLADAKIQQQIEGKTIRKWIIVPGRLVNLVAN